jgi:hypothetical protein
MKKKSDHKIVKKKQIKNPEKKPIDHEIWKSTKQEEEKKALVV